MSYKNVFWGVILIIIGSLFILKNLEIIYFNWGALFRLWPVLLILWGISIIPVKSGIRIILSLLVVALSVILIVNSDSYWRGWTFRFGDWNYEYSNNDNDYEGDWESQSIFEVYDDNYEYAYLSFDAAIGDFTLEDESEKLLEFEKDGNLGPYYLETKEKNDKVFIKMGLENNDFRGSNFENNAEIKLNSNPLWDLDIDVGAADIDLDLTKFRVKNLEIDGGASSIKIRLGELHDEIELNIDAGASSIDIWLPENSGCEIDATTVLTSRNFEGFTEIESGLHRTENYKSAENIIFINLDAAVASLNFRRY